MLSRSKFNSDLVMKALESSSPDDRIKSLQLLSETHLISDLDVRDAITKYAADRLKRPDDVPQIQNPVAMTAPLVANVRIFLLAGSVQKSISFNDLRSEFSSALYRVIKAQTLEDSSRPNGPEVRYFNDSDAIQARQIAEFVKVRNHYADIPTTKMNDPSAGPGYIEVWLGR